MWIYPAAPAERTSAVPKPPKPPVSPPVQPVQAEQTPALAKKKASLPRELPLLAACYLVGILAASLYIGLSSGQTWAFTQYYCDFMMKLHSSGDAVLVCSVRFLTSFVQLSLLLLCGLCAFGSPLAGMLLFLKGTGTGLFCAALYGQYGARGVLINLLLFWLPEVLETLLILFMGRFAILSARNLAALCFEHPRPAHTAGPQKLLFRYLVLCLIALVPCMLSAGLSLLFSPLL